MQIGEEESNGFEFDLAGEITPNWNILASYAYIDARITKTASNSDKGLRYATPLNPSPLWKYLDKVYHHRRTS